MKLFALTLKATLLSSACAALFCGLDVFILHVGVIAPVPNQRGVIAELFNAGTITSAANLGVISGVICAGLSLVPNFISLLIVFYFTLNGKAPAHKNAQLACGAIYGIFIYLMCLWVFIFGIPSRVARPAGEDLKVFMLYAAYLFPAGIASGIVAAKIVMRMTMGRLQSGRR
ncbi:MAG: hypothetical protein PW788_00455 [Micavibrio sp.]|nr:hypothetical protein [Micavibrio sp.]